MSIGSGAYLITSKENGLHVGRPPREDLSLLPKPIIVLPSKDISGTDNVWVVEKTDENVYILKSKGNPVAPQEGKLFADLLGDLQDNKWRIVAQPQHGENVFTVENADNRDGWVVPPDAEETSQVEVRPLIATHSLPPQYPPSELFIFRQLLTD